MDLLASPLFPNFLYLVLVAGLWFTALAVVTPGTGVYETLAAVALIISGLGILVIPLNSLAFLPLGIGAVLYGVSLWGRNRGVWLLLAAIFLSIGSAFIFEAEQGGPAVNLMLATFTSVLNIAFFWVIVRQAILAARADPTINPSRVLGLIGEARTRIDPTGSVYVGGELWSARSDEPIKAGAEIQVVDREGLMLTVSPESTRTEGEP